LNYRHPRGRFAGAVVVESSALVSARMTAAVYGLNDRLEFASGHQLDQESAGQIPANMIGRLLNGDDLRNLDRMVLKKKPPAPSVQRRTSAKRKVGEP
jgi:hypothetical protein